MELCNAVRTFSEGTQTPFYIYSEPEIENRVTALCECFPEQEYVLLYAMKANANPRIIKVLAA